MVRQAHSIPGKKSVFSPSMNSDSGSFPWSLTAKSLTPPIDFQPANVNFPVLRYTSLLMNSITTLDNLWMGRPRSIAAGLLESDGHRAVVDPGPGSTFETLQRQLQARGIGVGELDAILLTHIHLDHAGATGSLVRENPRLAVYVHKIGAPHVMDPSKLLASAQRLWPNELQRLFGETLPVPAENLHILEGGEKLTLGSRQVEVVYTPGHASHHVSYFDKTEGVAFVGDTAGVRIEGNSFDAHSRRVANKSDAFRLVEIADVVRGVARCVDNLDLPRAERECFTAFEDAQILRRNGKSFSEQALQFVGPEALGAGQKLRRVHHVRRAILVDIHGEAGIFAHQRAGSAGMVQV